MEKIVFFFWMIANYYSESRLTNSLYGKFRVCYLDGKVSERMSYRVASNYAEMFGGKVIYYKTKE